MFELFTLAQAAPISPIEPGISSAFSEILRLGLAGAILLLALIALWFKDRALQASQDGRLTDAKVITEIIKDHTAISQAQAATDAERTRALESTTKVIEKMAIVLEQVAKDVKENQQMLIGRKRSQ